MAWVWLAVFGQFLNAFVAVLDKYIVSDDSAIPKPFVYAFYSCLLGGVWLAIFAIGSVPFLAGTGLPTITNIKFPSLELLAMALLSACSFFLALVSMFGALKHDSPSNVMPVVGSVAAVSSLILSYLFLDTTLTDNFIVGILLLAVGTFLVSQASFTVSLVLATVHSGIFFALHLVTMKGLFEMTSFDNGFFWSRIALVLFALTLLLVPSYIKKIRKGTEHTTKRGGVIILFNKFIAGVAAFVLLKATDWGDVAVVQALDGLKFVFVLVISYFLTLFIPSLKTEKTTRPKDIIRKTLFICVIAIGFSVLFI